MSNNCPTGKSSIHHFYIDGIITSKANNNSFGQLKFINELGVEEILNYFNNEDIYDFEIDEIVYFYKCSQQIVNIEKNGVIIPYPPNNAHEIAFNLSSKKVLLTGTSTPANPTRKTKGKLRGTTTDLPPRRTRPFYNIYQDLPP